MATAGGTDASGDAVDASASSSDAALPEDATSPPDDPSHRDAGSFPDRLLFMTRGTFTGNLGGVAGADAKCAAAASESTVPTVRLRTFRAWVSVPGSTAASRLARDSRPIMLASNGSVFAAGWDAFANAFHAGGEAVFDQDGFLISAASVPVWTGTSATGTYAALSTKNCDFWTSGNAQDLGVFGEGNQPTDGAWSSATTAPCNSVHHLYCLEQ